MPEQRNITDDEVLDFMKSAVDHLAQEARDKWISGEYGFTHKERLIHAHEFDYVKKRARELIKAMKPAKVGV